jgi:hypothetical protein
MEAPMRSDRDARIRQRAYQIWHKEGRRHGSHDAHWRQAEREIAAEDAALGSKKDGAARSKATPPVASEATPVIVSGARAKDAAAAKQPPPARRGRQRAPAEPGE